MIEGAESVAVGGVIASNMINVRTRSSIELDLRRDASTRPPHRRARSRRATSSRSTRSTSTASSARRAARRSSRLGRRPELRDHRRLGLDQLGLRRRLRHRRRRGDRRDRRRRRADSDLARAVSDGGSSIAARPRHAGRSPTTSTRRTPARRRAAGPARARRRRLRRTAAEQGGVYRTAGPTVDADYIASLVGPQLRDVMTGETVQLPFDWTGYGDAGATYKFTGTAAPGQGPRPRVDRLRRPTRCGEVSRARSTSAP